MAPFQRFFFWSPRILGIGFALFLPVFALDVFSEYSGWGIVLPLFIHLIPSLVLLAAIAVAWKFDLFGALVFVGSATLYIWSVGFDRPWSWYATIALPPAIIGALFLISWLQKRD